MAKANTDQNMLKTISELVKEEQDLYAREPMDDAAVTRVESIKVELDQCWDLLRQRRALQEFGEDPDKAKVRPPSVVESYEQ
jgi:hypothetical protein